MKCHWLPLVAGILLAAITGSDAGSIVHGERAFDAREADYFHHGARRDKIHIGNGIPEDLDGMMAETKDQVDTSEREDAEGKFNRLLEPERKKEVLEKGLRQPLEDDINCADVSSDFRTVDGTCNNLQDSHLGAANTAYNRLVSPDYEDDFNAPRVAMSGQALPNAREVSFRVFTEVNKPSKKFSHLAVPWGQYVGHDVSKIGSTGATCGKTAQTCNIDGTDCFGIIIPGYDPYFKHECISLTRTLATGDPSEENPRQQENVKTSFLDGSPVYGSDSTKQQELRDLTSEKGLMKETLNPNGRNSLNLLAADNRNPNCRSYDPDKGIHCFDSGDGERVNQNTGLISVQTLLLREHNRIANELYEMNHETWDNERIYQETRKIVGAIVQHITYNEFLPELLSTETRNTYNLILQEAGYFEGYNDSVNPSAINSFATAAFRLGHSMVRNEYSRHGPTPYNRPFDPVPLKSHYDNPVPFYDVCQGGVDALFRGLFADPGQTVDRFFSTGITQHLSRSKGEQADLAALDIQRGRDHGLPGYNQYREYCGLVPFTDFSEFPEVGSTLSDLYEVTDDVDLFVGGILENNEADGFVGETFSCIIATQFDHLRRGDRFWYETDDASTGFTADQLTEIRKTSLAGVICQNSDSIDEISEKAMSVASNTIPCSEVMTMDLSLWEVVGGAAEADV